jgi:hypothetical protein
MHEGYCHWGPKQGFPESSSKLLQTFVTPKNQTEERILERTKVKAKKIEKDNVGHNNGGIGKATTSLDDESNQSCNFNNRELG